MNLLIRLNVVFLVALALAGGIARQVFTSAPSTRSVVPAAPASPLTAELDSPEGRSRFHRSCQ